MARPNHSVRIAALEQDVVALKKANQMLVAQLASERDARVAGEAALSKRLAAQE